MDNGLPEFNFVMDDLPELTQKEPVVESPEQEEPVKEQDELEIKKKEDAVEPVVETTQEPEVPEVPQTDVEPEEELTLDQERLKALYTYHKEQGHISHEGEFDGSLEQWDEILRSQPYADKERVEKTILEAMPDTVKDLVEFALNQGEGITKEQLKEFLNITETSVPEVTTEEQAKSYLLSKYTSVHGEDTAARFVEALEDSEALLSTATKEIEKEKEQISKQSQVKLEQSREQKLEREKNKREFETKLNNELANTNWSNTVKKAVWDEIYSQSLRTKTSQIGNYPKALIQLANYMRFFDPKTGEINEDEFTKSGKSTAAKELKDNLERTFGKSAGFGSNTTVTKKKEDKNINYTFAN